MAPAPVPEQWTLAGDAGVGKLVTLTYPYFVYYAVDEQRREIVILSIKHPAQQREHDDW